ncbi:histidine kinase 1 [Malania oleifera]|uniref:histidine kinase 1 n=1 Tax=Malania oleifera TaxID=397392 RepID=UPI0025AEB243|nr:histidine kinase 1 [Malania oleifera]
MSEKADRTPSASFDPSSTLITTMGKPLRIIFNRISGFATSWKSNQAPRGRRIFHRNVQQEDSQNATTRCLSSYYSVFVARLTIMVMLAILIGLLTVLTWHFTRVYTTKSINSLAYGLRFELLQRPILRMWNILNSTVEVATAQVKLSEFVIRRYNKPATQAEQVELYGVMREVTWALFASRKALDAITINYKNGFVQAFHRDHRTNRTFYIYSDLVDNSINGTYDINTISSHNGWSDQSIHGNVSAIWYHEQLDPITGEKIGKPRPIPPDDLINIPNLSQVPDGVASWHVTVSKYIDSPLLSAALPVWDDSNKSIVAVVGVTTAFYSVGQLMKELVEFHSGHIFLTSQEGYLLATSTNAPLLTNSTAGPELMMAIDSEDNVIHLGAKWLQKHCHSEFPPTREVHVENVKLGDQKYYIDSFFLNLKRLPMVGVIIIPRKHIMGKVDERAFKTLVILISASVCILAIGCACILILTNGVSKEMKLRAQLISHLDARRKAEASSNYKTQFLANMSHELRTPMAAVIGLLDILISDDSLTNDQYETVTQIRKCSTALLRLLNNILDISKIESGKLVLEETEFDLGRELEGLVDMFSVQCINHNVETVLDLSDDMPKLVCGDSARVVQIFANLISNSVKFTTSGHIILRGWCENSNDSSRTKKLSRDQKETRSALKSMLKQHGNNAKKACRKDNKIIVWFEVDDTGCGIDPSKWESVFESFEQADPSTTRTHGGTGLGLCIVRTLVNKMGGQIKVVKKNGPGTLMRLYLVLSTPADGTGQHCQLDFAEHSIAVLLALNGNMGRLIISQWLRKNEVFTWEASGWNELTKILGELFQARISISNFSFDKECAQGEPFKTEALDLQEMGTSVFVVVVDIGILDLRTDIWKEQLNFLHRYHGKAKFAWTLNHDTSNAIKVELRRKGHLLMVNKPLYKAKMIQIIEAVVKERNLELQKGSLNALRTTMIQGDLHESHDIEFLHPNAASSDDSDKSEIGSLSSTNAPKFGEKQGDRNTKPCATQHPTVKNCFLDFAQVSSKNNNLRTDDKCQIRPSSFDIEAAGHELMSTKKASLLSEHEYENGICQPQHLINCSPKNRGTSYSNKVVNGQKSLEGVRILLAEDTPVLQKVATIMLEKLGAKVIAVDDGKQAVDALECMLRTNGCRSDSSLQDGKTRSQTQFQNSPPYDLILMDCQMPKMDGYEATKAIRKSEEGTGLHIPIVALTAHAMSSDEAKCLEVGMDAYLTKPIDCKLMVSTILSLTKRMH